MGGLSEREALRGVDLRRWPHPVGDANGQHDNTVWLSFRRSGVRSVRPALPHSGTIRSTVQRTCRFVFERNGAGGGNRTHTGKSPTNFHTSYGFRRHPHPRSGWAFVVWTIPSPCFGEPKGRCCPSSLYTFRSAFALRLGSGSPSDRVPRI